MSETEMKLEVIRKITNLDDHAILKAVYSILTTTEDTGEKINLTRNYEAIKSQYGDILKKLAE